MKQACYTRVRARAHTHTHTHTNIHYPYSLEHLELPQELQVVKSAFRAVFALDVGACFTQLMELVGCECVSGGGGGRERAYGAMKHRAHFNIHPISTYTHAHIFQSALSSFYCI